MSRGDVWKIADHPDQDKYSGQKIYFVIVEDYIYLVPHIIERDYIFLKTIIVNLVQIFFLLNNLKVNLLKLEFWNPL